MTDAASSHLNDGDGERDGDGVGEGVRECLGGGVGDVNSEGVGDSEGEGEGVTKLPPFAVHNPYRPVNSARVAQPICL